MPPKRNSKVNENRIPSLVVTLISTQLKTDSSEIGEETEKFIDNTIKDLHKYFRSGGTFDFELNYLNYTIDIGVILKKLTKTVPDTVLDILKKHFNLLGNKYDLVFEVDNEEYAKLEPENTKKTTSSPNKKSKLSTKISSNTKTTMSPKKIGKVYVDNAANRKLGRVGLPYETRQKLSSTRKVSPKKSTPLKKKQSLQSLPKSSAKKVRNTKISSSKPKQLLVCHGSIHENPSDWEKADTLDYREEAKPTLIFDISKDNVPQRYMGKYDSIQMQYCGATAYLDIENRDFFSKRKKQHIIPNRKAFKNLYNFLKANGTLIINNFSLYINNIKTDRRGVDAKTDLFMKTISDLFKVKKLELIDKEYALTLIRR